MTHPHLTDMLNEPQLEAVTAPPGNLLILAGAGSGKTRVLVHRIAWLMAAEHISPFAILSVTFTNKAAHEMRHRIESLHGMPLRGMWVGTFHGLAHRLLRAHWQQADLPEAFQILDSDDQYRLIRRVLRSLNLEENKWPPKQAQWFINKCKEEGKRPTLGSHGDSSFFEETMQRVYAAYETICKQSGLVDFSELLLRSLELLQNNTELRQHYQQRFQHVLVDEFQDTNAIQYLWLQTLAGPDSYVIAVGDDDQSIYSWRGARIENIHQFERDYSNVKTIRLEQNYRSTQTILTAANSVISNNGNRMGKNLWTNGDDGELITLYAAFNERDEAFYIVSSIRNWVREGGDYKGVAILYRSNAQSRILEEYLLDAQIAYRIYGGQKFFERAEIKDALAYLRLISNRHDDAAFERVVNTPTRGIGNTTLNSLRERARDLSLSLWQAVQHIITHKDLSSRATSALQAFIDLIDTIDTETQEQPLGEQTNHCLHRSALLDHYKKDRSEKGISRVENLEELVTATNQFKASEETKDLSTLAAFLSHVALESGEGQAEPNTNCVHLMTLHAAKGLEFPCVFLSGLEEDLFPHKMSVEERDGLEEERRLCYVGMTRAMKKLVLTYAESRYLHGTERFNLPSRFIQEIPNELLNSIRPSAKVSRPSGYGGFTPNKPQRSVTRMVSGSIPGTNLRIGQQVMHPKFGSGIIINFEGSGDAARVQVNFDQCGSKWLVASFAKLEPIK